MAGERIPVMHDEGVSVEIIRVERQAPLIEVTLDVEVVDDARAQLQGFRSMRSVADVNCQPGLDRVREAQVFDQPRLSGQRRAWTVKGAWVRPSDDAYMASVVRQVCGGARELPRPAVPSPIAPSAERVQVASLPSEAAARKILDAFSGRLPAGLETQVETAMVRGRMVHRALITGFKSLADAREFCRAMSADAHDCLVRSADPVRRR